MDAGRETPEDTKLALSKYSDALFDSLNSIKAQYRAPDLEYISVSQTVSFFSILYEKVRNAMEFREEHLVRRAAIERILNRRMMMSPKGTGEAENLIKELMWARYLRNNSLTQRDVDHIQEIIDKYVKLKELALQGRTGKWRVSIVEFLTDFMTCEIEEELNPAKAQKSASYLYFFYRVLNAKVALKNVSQEDTDAFFYVAAETAFAKNDRAYIRYHLFKLLHSDVHSQGDEELSSLAAQLPESISRIDQIMRNPYHEKLVRFTKKHTAPFLILFAVLDRYPHQKKAILQNKSELWSRVDAICREKYQQTGIKLRTAAVRSVIYIFLTKALFALVLEFPLSNYFFGEAILFPVVTNTFLPPLLMALLVSFVHVPDEKNTRRIYSRIVDIITRNHGETTDKVRIGKRVTIRRPILLLGFSALYTMTFVLTFALIYGVLDFFDFNIINKAVFVFFISLVAFFGYRVRQIAKEYTVSKPGNIFSPIIDFFFVPILFVGKWLSQEIAKLNILILVFDFLIEAPFKLISEIVEEWINFVRARKEEII